MGVYLGWAPARHLQLYFDTEKFMGDGVSGATGLGGLTNGEVVRAGAENLPKRPYIARVYLRYMVPLGSEVTVVERSQDHVPGIEPVTRLEVKVGRFAVNDAFDVNRYAGSARTQFLNWSLWANTAWDFAANTRGFSDGAVVAYVSPQWSLRYGIFKMPEHANGQALEALSRARGQQLELEVQPGSFGTVVRALAYVNTARMGLYSAALAQAVLTGAVPDIVGERRDGRHKYGFGVNLEQPLADDGETGVFARIGWNNGETESFAFTEVDRTFTIGGQLAGGAWGRPRDRAGVGLAVNALSGDHRSYLAAGGSGFLLGDGRLTYDNEEIIETYYRLQLGNYVQLSPDCQLIRNPGFNHDRGPVAFFALRVHAEY
jgi:carbohydrate-selective porin OprB